LNGLAKGRARCAEDDTLLAGVTIAIKVGTQERGHNRRRGPKDALRDLLGASANTGLHSKVFKKIRDDAGAKSKSPSSIVPMLAAFNIEEIARNDRECFGLLFVAGCQANHAFDDTDVAVANQIPEELAKLLVDDIWNAHFVTAILRVSQSGHIRVVVGNGRRHFSRSPHVSAFTESQHRIDA